MGGALQPPAEDKQHAEQRHFGPHVAWIEDPDIFGIRFVGPLKGDELRGIFAWQDEWSTSNPSLFVLCDLSQLGSVREEARKCMHERTKRDNALICVCYGMNFAIRILVEMVDRARKFLGRDPRSELIMVATEADARAYIGKRRGRS
jgi:hypothetical protein